MTEEDKQQSQMEAMLPSLSGSAFSAAFQKAIEAGFSVLISENGAIYEVFPDGHRIKLKDIPPDTPMQPGTRITIP